MQPRFDSFFAFLYLDLGCFYHISYVNLDYWQVFAASHLEMDLFE
jgi:hypothetical protein